MSYPSTWMKIKFGEVAEIVNDRIDNPKESGLSDYIGLEHLDTDQIRIKRYGSPDEVEATKFICKKGDIIFGKRRAYLRKLAVTERDAVVSAHSMVLRPKGEKIQTRFLPWFMHSSIFWMTAQAISEGSLSPTIKWKTLKAQEFWIPSIPEQKKISEILWTIEDNIEKTEKLIRVTEKLKKGLLEQLLTKGIGHKNFKKTELGEIPEDWKIVDFSELVFLQRGFDLPKKERTKGNYPLVASNGIIDNISEFMVKGPGVITGRSGTLGEVHYVEKNYWPLNTTLFSKDLKNNDAKFVFYFLKNFDVSRFGAGSGVPTLNRNDLHKLKIRLPPLIEQQQIAEIMDVLQVNINNYFENLNSLIDLKKKLTNEFLSGNLLIPKEVLN